MHLESFGQGPDLVLLHGWAMHGGVFEPLVERLQNRYRLHCVDLPGHGQSVAASGFDLAAIADELAARWPRAAWLGWSLGGLVALKLALRHRAAVRALVLVAASPRFTHAEDWPCAVSASVFEQFASALAEDLPRTLERFLALETLGAEHAQDERHWLRGLIKAVPQPSATLLTQGLAILHDTDLRTSLPDLQPPTLWIGGRRDRLVPPAAIEAAAALCANGGALIVEQAAHAPFIGRPQAFADALEDFLQRVPQ